MNAFFEELDYRPTRMGPLSLRRRRELSDSADVYEVKLGDEFLMSSRFTESEIALARIGLEAVPGAELDVVVGGLGLGYTAQAVLQNDRVGSLIVVDALAEVIEWHRTGLLPIGPQLISDPRCRLVHADFFAAVLDPERALDPNQPGRRFDAILVDIDHSPAHLLDPNHARFYEPEGLRLLPEVLRPAGIFALWSNDRPDELFRAALGQVFATAEAIVVPFRNPLQNRDASSTIYVARAHGPS